MNEKGKRLQQQKQEDAAFNKMLMGLGGLLVLEVLALLVRRYFINFTSSDSGLKFALGLNSFFGVFRFVGIAVAAACCVWLVLTVKKGGKVALPLICTAFVLWLWVAALLCHGLNSVGTDLLCALPVALMILCAIYFLYQREFFLNGVLGGLGIVALWIARQIYMNHPRMTYCGVAALCVIMALAAAAVFVLNKRGGKLGKVQILSAGASPLPVYLTCIVVVLTVLVAVLLNATVVGYYAIGVLVAWLFCLAVYYTVKLM